MGFFDRFFKKHEEDDADYYEEYLGDTRDRDDDLDQEDDELDRVPGTGRRMAGRRPGGDWERVIYTRDGVNIDDASARRQYVQNCLLQMEEGNRQVDSLQIEYRTVTSYLHDMEVVDALPADVRAEINRVAQRIYENEEQRQSFLQRKGKLTDKEYEKVEKLHGEEKEAIRKMKESEEFHRKIRKDLIRLDNERQAYDVRKVEAEKALVTNRQLSVMVTMGLLIILIVLVTLQMAFDLDVALAYMLVILVAALSIVWLYFRHGSCMRERKSVRAAKSRLIQLQNSVKIRYVNNLNLLDYLYIKYGVQSSAELESLMVRYKEERAQRLQYEEAERNLAEDQRELLRLLRMTEIKTPEVWLHQVEALINHNEEVEVRHNLITQRQNLRKRMDYNREMVVGGARAEIEDLARSYPRYANEILDQVARFQGVEL